MATRKQYEEHLNDTDIPQGSDQWIIGGKIRMYDMWKNTYGSALRKHDPIAFNTGYNEFNLTN